MSDAHEHGDDVPESIRELMGKIEDAHDKHKMKEQLEAAEFERMLTEEIDMEHLGQLRNIFKTITMVPTEIRGACAGYFFGMLSGVEMTRKRVAGEESTFNEFFDLDEEDMDELPGQPDEGGE